MTTKTNSIRLQRRDFLKVMGAGTTLMAAITVSSAPVREWFLDSFLPAQISFGESLLRGTWNGQLFQSLDNGQTWEKLFFFGSHCAINSLLTQNGQVFAQLTVAGYPFWLYSTDAKTWHTLD